LTPLLPTVLCPSAIAQNEPVQKKQSIRQLILWSSHQRCQVSNQLRKQRKFSERRFHCRDRDSEAFPINVLPLKGKGLRRRPEATPAAQSDDSAKFEIVGAIYYCLDLIRRDETAATSVYRSIAMSSSLKKSQTDFQSCDEAFS
jgi:hypothetical protein